MSNKAIYETAAEAWESAYATVQLAMAEYRKTGEKKYEQLAVSYAVGLNSIKDALAFYEQHPEA